MVLFDDELDAALVVILAADNRDVLEDGEHARVALVWRLIFTIRISFVFVVMSLLTTSDVFYISGEQREEVIAVDIDGFRVMSNTSFREHFRMNRIIFQVTFVCHVSNFLLYCKL